MSQSHIPHIGRPAVLSVSNVARGTGGDIHNTGLSATSSQLPKMPSRPPTHDFAAVPADAAMKENVLPNFPSPSASAEFCKGTPPSTKAFTVSTTVRQILASLSPRMDSPAHLEWFWKAGIRDEETLASFEACNFLEKAMIYKELQDLGLSPLELIALRRYFQ